MVGDPDVVVRIYGPVEGLVRHEGDVLDLREAVDEVGDAVADADRRRMEGDVERETAGPREGRGVAAGDAVLLEDEDRVPLPGEGRGRAEAAEAGADDDGVVGRRAGVLSWPPRGKAFQSQARSGIPARSVLRKSRLSQAFSASSAPPLSLS